MSDREPAWIENLRASAEELHLKRVIYVVTKNWPGVSSLTPEERQELERL